MSRALVAAAAAAIVVVAAAAAAETVAAPTEEQDDQDDDPNAVIAVIAEHSRFLSPHFKNTPPPCGSGGVFQKDRERRTFAVQTILCSLIHCGYLFD